jgi:hypothetical protein
MTNPYKLSIIKQMRQMVLLLSFLSSVYRIEVSDFMGNKTIVSIPISYDQATPIVQKEFVPSNYFVK